MALDLKYGQINVPNIPDDEPIFIMRAQDSTTVRVIGYYADNAENEDAPEELVRSAERSANIFGEWQQANSEKVKIPD